MSSSSVQVVVRLRPMNDKEKKEGTLPVISASTTNKSVTVIKGVGAKQARSQFSFDNVFTSFSNQQDVFSATLQPVITDVLQGFETCVFAYGQTGTGKTHTMEGNLQDPDHYGIIPRSAQALFDALDSPQYVQTNVTCSYLEIYNEELSDLLVASSSGPPSSATKHQHLSSASSTKLDIVHGSKKQGVHCRGLSEQAVHSADDVLQLMQRAVQARRTGETRMNKQSSRSHCIFTMRVEAKRTLPDGSSVLESQGKLHLVDLAGSESAKTAELKESSAAQQATREQERRNINKSLLTLGRVISMLKEQAGKKSKTMIPYRDSKLTRILQEALGGRCKTVIIATISPSILNVQESLQTLHYAQTANGIKNKPAVSNSYMSLGSAAGAVDMASLSSGDKTVPVERWQEMEIRMEHMQQEVEEARQALARNYMQQQGLEDRADKAEKAKDEIQFALGKANTQLETLSQNLEDERTVKEMVTAQLRQTEITLTKTAAVLKATQQTEKSLTLEALALLQSLKESIGDGDKLYSMVQTSHNEELSKRSATRDYHESISVALNSAVSKLDDIAASEKDNILQVSELMSIDHTQRIQAIEEAKAVVSKIASVVATTVSTVNHGVSDDMIPTLDSLAAGVKSNVETTRKLVVEGEATLSSSCSEALAQLKSFGEQLGEMDKDFNKLKETSLSNVEKTIMETKSNVSAMVVSATTSIQAVRDRSVETRADLVELIEEWTTAGATATSHVKNISSSQQLALETAFTMLESEMHNHQSVDQELAFAQDFISKGQTSHRSIFDSQNNKIRNQKQALDDSAKSHETLCDQVMETVMGGVKDLVAQQLKLIVTNHTERTGKLVRTNEDILGLHNQLSDKSSAMLTTLSATNTKLQSHAKAMHLTDSSILKTLNEGNSKLAEVEQTVVDFEASNMRFDERARAEIVILESVDENIGDIQQNVATNGKSCVEQIDTSTQQIVSESISSVGQVGSKALAFARDDIIRSVSTSIAKVEKPRESLMHEVSQNLQTIEEKTQSGLVDVVTLAKQNIVAIEGASESVNESVKDFSSSRSAMYQSQCEDSRKQITTMLETHETAIQALASSCKENVITSKDNSSRFGHEVIKMDYDVEDVPHKFALEYSEALSSTLDENDLFKGIDFGSRDVTMGSSVGSPSTKDQVAVSDELSPGPDVLKESSLNNQDDPPRDESQTNKSATRKRAVDVNSRLPKRSKQRS